MNKMVLKFNKIFYLFMSIENFGIQEKLFDGLDIYLQHALNSVCDWF